ncbi:hypothetical protein Theam_1147 [Thermovibrio ammonificans HB-1]|uniref:PilC beta-propeller domain-containing protein n=1 Tax=Thermovibrio ammonificans (strain DSM 15698 / JCM 12110 / HB-1) TaxID=648996 RepID=E8T2L6_THEA1|nr:hypothetical protein [Thermovibrio ammonificans]ADU97111.1 hypothetical protein Theam_1147 [Thermovibrio ammonificans HB-1]
MRLLSLIITVLVALGLLVKPAGATAPSDYCAVPPFIQKGAFANVMLALDYSGSMAWKAYEGKKKSVYYGYFIPDRYYCKSTIHGRKVWTLCSKYKGKSKLGSKLNREYMTRIDILRWILTGGKVVEFYGDRYVELAATDKKGNTLYIKATDVSSYNPETGEVEGILQKLERRREKPRIGLVIYPGSTVCLDYDSDCPKCLSRCYSKCKSEGHSDSYCKNHCYSKCNCSRGGWCSLDYLNPIRDWVYPTYDYSKIIDLINNEVPNGGTPTGEVLDEIKRYFAREDGVWNFGFRKSDPNYLDPYTFDVDGQKVEVHCAKNFTVLISDGAWNGHIFSAERACPSCDNNSKCVKDPVDTNVRYSCAIDPAVPAYDMHVNDLVDTLTGVQNVDVYTVAAFMSTKECKGDKDSCYGVKSLENTAIFGGFLDEDGDGYPCNYSSVPPAPVCSDTKSAPCGSFNDVEPACSEWDANGDGLPDNYFEGSDPEQLKAAIESVFYKILQRASGTSVMGLPEKSKLGFTLQQSVFYTMKNIYDPDTDRYYQVTWPGYLYTWWFYNTRTNQNIREDTNENLVLDVDKDRILEWAIEDNNLKIKIYEPKADGSRGDLVTTVDSFDSPELHPLWEEGEILAETPGSDRNIFTTTTGSNKVPFTVANLNDFKQLLGTDPNLFPACVLNPDGTVNYEKLVKFVRGEPVDFSNCRNLACGKDRIWKLGDIDYSTPTIVNYGNYNVVFVGANDGMLHAFLAGYVKKNAGDTKHPVAIQNSSTDDTTDKLGEELWAFIPKDALPYLRFLTGKDYCHTYFVDLTPQVYTVNGRKILIGGMRLGGAACVGGDNCVKPPADTCSSASCTGLSAYFALDVTNPQPDGVKVLWEFTAPGLGFTYSGPSLIRKGDKAYLMFVSGPETYNGDSNQPLKVFVVDLLSGKEVATFDTFIPAGSTTGRVINDAFGGRLMSEGLDVNGDGSTDYVFFGYARKDGDMKNWKGGIVMADVRDPNPLNWKFYTYLDDAIPPVTARIKAAKCFSRYYIYFGTGRWFYKTDNVLPGQANRLYGLSLSCNGDSCTVVTDASDNSQNVCTDAANGVIRGWYIELNTQDEGYFKERDISDPTTTDQNVVLFTTIEPTDDICSSGGRTRVWALNCATGGSILEDCSTYGINKVYGTLLLQLSGANIQQITIKFDKQNQVNNVAQVFTSAGNRATSWYTGIAPESAPPFIAPGSRLVGTLLLWLER